MDASGSGAAFPRYISDITPAQRRTVEGYIARLREGLVRALDGQGIPGEVPDILASRAIHAALVAADIAAEELKPKYMRGYGEVPETTAVELNGIAGELHRLITELDRYVAREAGQDLRGRLERLEEDGADLRLLAKIEEVVTDRGLVEFRGAIASVLDRVEDMTFEIALFGRVSTGKSSLLNAILDTGALPVGTTPVTAVPIRVIFGEEPSVAVSYTNEPPASYAIARLAEFASEEQNPGNEKQVSRIVVALPAPCLRDGIAFVDTPGLGSLASHGAAETLAYLPACDLGVVLIDAGSTLTAGDVQAILALSEAAVPVHLVLSKADLLTPQESEKTIRYLQEQIEKECGLELPVHPVSTLPSHRHLLDRWFDDEIVPLFDCTEEVKEASVRRKIACLRRSVISGLRLQLQVEREQRASSDAGEVEARLRQAVGSIEETRSACEQEIERMSGCLPQICADAASRLMDSGGDAGDETIWAAVVGPARCHAENVRAAVEALAVRLQDDLVTCARDLGVTDMPGDGEFLSYVRDLPVYDHGFVSVRVPGSSYAVLFGRQFAERRLANRISREIEGPVGQSLDGYRRSLLAWTRMVTGQVSREFEVYAEHYLAQARRPADETVLAADEMQRIEDALSP